MGANGLDTPEVMEKAKRASERGLCATCLGRAFGAPEKGTTSAERGRRIAAALGAEPRAPEACGLCEGLCAEFDVLAGVAREALEGYEFSTLLVGTTLDPLLSARESEFATALGLENLHTLKQEVNREVGLRLEAALGKEVDFGDPDIAVHLEARFNTVKLQVKSAYFRGRYRKLARGVPQTRWPCRSCRGRGCARCGGTGKLYETSVEEIVARPLMALLGGEDHALHGAGREDVDALMLGRGRPFIVEIRRPKRRSLEVGAALSAIAAEASGRVEVGALAPCSKAEVATLKDADWRKSYRVLVALEKDIKDDQINRACAELSGSVIDQQTPTRVAHRRADKVRQRKATSVRVLTRSGPVVELEVTGDSGLYVKELVHGDQGRTRPSLAELLGVACEVRELDVLDIHDE